MKHKTKRRFRISLVSLLVILSLVAGGFYIYTLDYYHADAKAQQVFSQASKNVPGKKSLSVFRDADLINSSSGIIFYPGGKVEAKAYAPLLFELAGRGYTVVLTPMPFNLAVFGINKANQVYETFPEVKNWFLAGHSLGGAMASSYAQKHADKLSGLILLGAYPLGESTLPTLAIYGTFDKGIDKDKLSGVETLEILGGNHAYFGDYGEQKGDGTATILREDQQNQAVEAMDQFIKETLTI